MSTKRRRGKRPYIRRNSCRASTANIMVYLWGTYPLGEPTRMRLESFKHRIEHIKTYRKKDLGSFIFVECKAGEMNEKQIMVIGFDENGINRTYCKSIKSWDKRLIFL